MTVSVDFVPDFRQSEEGDNYRFIGDEKDLIRAALEYLKPRFLRMDIIQNAIDQAEHDRDFWMFHNDPPGNWKVIRDKFVDVQRETLKRVEEFRLIIRPMNPDEEGEADDGSWTMGQAASGIVVIDDDHVEGDFRIKLNKFVLANPADVGSVGYDMRFWAGVIAHEIMHNLGHDHPIGEYNGHFIRVFERAIQADGQWSRPSDYPIPGNSPYEPVAKGKAKGVRLVY